MMKLSQGVKIYCKSMGKVFEVQHIARDEAEANEFCRRHDNAAVIAVDSSGLVYIANKYSTAVPSSVLPD